MMGIEEKILTRKSVYDGKIVHLEHLDVELPNGKKSLREVMRHVGASAVVPVDAEGNVTLVRQYRTAVEKVLLEIPAGKLDGKGEDRLLAAKRELREETGLTAGRFVHLTDVVTTPGFCDEVISIYLALDLTQGDTDPDEDEFLRLERLPLAKAVAMAARGEIGDAKTVCGLLLAEKAIKEGR